MRPLPAVLSIDPREGRDWRERMIEDHADKLPPR
jgi:hypothetical protein